MDGLVSRYVTLKRESIKSSDGEVVFETLKADDGLYKSIVNIFHSGSGIECYERIVKLNEG